MIAIIDNALSDDHFKEFKDTIDIFLTIKAETLWFELGIYEDPHIRKLLHLASKYIDLSKVVGYEAWTHNNTIPIGDNDDGWHKDRDELSYHVRKIFRFPVCSIVFYTEIKDLQGGELIVEDTIITPKENRVVIFGPGLIHKVNEFEGQRVSLSINPWNRLLEKYK